MFKINIVARLSPNDVPGAVSLLGPDGRCYVLYYRVTILGIGVNWTPVKFVATLPA